jgi:hypothetical protein
MAAVLVTARLCEPSSELHIAEDWYRRTALADLLQLGDEEVNKDCLYRALDHLLQHKQALEVHLAKRCGEMFKIQNEVLLYALSHQVKCYSQALHSVFTLLAATRVTG